MDVSAYIGHDSQIYGIEEHRIVGGKGDGMRMLMVRNGLGLEFMVSEDRACDIPRLSYKGDNFSFFSVDGYVGPEYYNPKGFEWLKSFTAGFLTTCGLTAVGDPEISDGEETGLHGLIANQPAEHVCWYEDGDRLVIRGKIPHMQTLGTKLVLNRCIEVSTEKNEFTITDTIKNLDAKPSPLMLLYHMNMGYPLLSETSELCIPSASVSARTPFALEGIGEWNRITPPQPGIDEQCYFHTFAERGNAALYNPSIGKGVVISFDPKNLDYFTQWKMMGVRDYVLGLEPGNCLPSGRNAMRESGGLKILEPFGEKTYSVKVRIVDGEAEWKEIKASF